MAAFIFSASRRVGAGLLLGLSLLGCSRAEPMLAQPLPVLVQPAGGEPWGIEVAMRIDQAIHLDVANASPRPVRVLWDECVYLDGKQEAHRLLTAGAWQRRDFAAQVPATLAPNSRLHETLYPLAAGRERLGPLVPPPPNWGARTWVDMKRRLFFQWHARPSLPPPQTVSVFLVLEDQAGRKTLMAPYAIGRTAPAALP